MSYGIPRMRMFAGPNGSGKTTVKRSLNKPASWFGIYINPDELEQEIQETGKLITTAFGLAFTIDELRAHFANSTFLQTQNLHHSAPQIQALDDAIDFRAIVFTSYHASVLADFLRRKALEYRQSFTFETVMSARDKVELLAEAQQRGFRTYLYYIATEDPAINIERVRNRVAEGGHDVPEWKIIERHQRSISMLADAIRSTHRAYLFDTSSEDPWYFAEVSDGVHIELKSDEIPTWFSPVLDHLTN